MKTKFIQGPKDSALNYNNETVVGGMGNQAENINRPGGYKQPYPSINTQLGNPAMIRQKVIKEIDNVLNKQLIEERILSHTKEGKPYYRREMVRPETLGYEIAPKDITETIKGIEEQLNFISQNARRFSHLAPTQQEEFANIISRAHKILGTLGKEMYKEVKQKKAELGVEFYTHQDPINPMNRARSHLKNALKYIQTNKPLLVEHELVQFGRDYSEALHKYQEGSKEKIIKSEFFKEELKKYSHPKLKVFVVDGQYVRNNYNVDFTEGGHHYRFDFIPENEIWLDLDVNVKEIKFVLLHELIERRLMKTKNLEYDLAHTKASEKELNARRTNGTKIDNLIDEELSKLNLNKISKEYGTISSGGFTPTFGGDGKHELDFYRNRIKNKIDNLVNKNKIWDSLNNRTVTLSALDKAYHPLHGQSFKSHEQAGRKLSGIGAKHVKTIPREQTKTRVYSHPSFGTFTSVEGKKGKTTIFHYPMPKRD